MIKSGNKIVQVVFSPLSFEALTKIKKYSGLSYSRVVSAIVDCHLSEELDKISNKLEVLNETKTKNETS